MKETKLFTKMPRTGILTLKKGQMEFKKIVDQIYNEPSEIYFKNIANMIYKKLFFNDTNNCWGKEDYKNFKYIFSTIDAKKIDVLGISIQKCLEASNLEIYRELQLLSKQVDWYPGREKVCNNETNKYCYKEKEITLTDCFEVSISLMKYMLQFINQQSKNYLDTYCQNEDNFIDIVNNIKEDNVLLELIFTKFDERFKFVTEYPLFESIYFKIRSNLIERIIECIYFYYSNEKRNKEKNVPRDANFEGFKAGRFQMIVEKKQHNKKYLVRAIRRKNQR